MITLRIQGGLGNQLFQIAFSDYLARLNTTPVYLTLSNKKDVPPHANINYFDTLFKNWNPLRNNDVFTIYSKRIFEPYYSYLFKSKYTILKSNILIIGFFQTTQYIQSDFVSKLDFSSSFSVLEKYANISECVFLHIRGGDYIHTESSLLYNIDLNNYYTKAISMFPENTTFMIFTDDNEYTKTKSFLNNIKYQFIDENEVDSLFLMSKCKGGICANSTFSWWGAYLNRNRLLTFPSKWRTDMTSSSYHFEGLTVVEI